MDRFFSGYFGFLLSLSFHQCPILIYTLFLSGQTAEVWEPFKKQWSFGIWRALDREILFVSLYRINKRRDWLYTFWVSDLLSKINFMKATKRYKHRDAECESRAFAAICHTQRTAVLNTIPLRLMGHMKGCLMFIPLF